MTEQEFEKLFRAIDAEGDEYLEDDRIKSERRLHIRRDLNAFLLLDKLAGREDDNSPMICHARHDEYHLDLSPEDVCQNATEEDIRDLIRCGVRLDGGFVMFA